MTPIRFSRGGPTPINWAQSQPGMSMPELFPQFGVEPQLPTALADGRVEVDDAYRGGERRRKVQ
jgi:hypothetical protein